MKARTTFSCKTQSPEETRALGVKLGALLHGGDCLALHGELGSGKTTLSGGLGVGAEIAEPLASPTYLLCCEYQGRVNLLHLDAYFSDRMDGLLAEGLVERFDSETVVVVEWATHMEEWLPKDRLELDISGSENSRVFDFKALGERSASLLAHFASGIL